MAARQEKLTGVPAAQVDQVVQDFKDAGATFVEKTPEGSDNPPKTYTVVATFAT